MSDPSRWVLCRLDLRRFREEMFLPSLIITESLVAVVSIVWKTDCRYPHHWSSTSWLICVIKDPSTGYSHCYTNCFLNYGRLRKPDRIKELHVRGCCCVMTMAKAPFIQAHKWALQMQRCFHRATTRCLFCKVLYSFVALYAHNFENCSSLE